MSTIIKLNAPAHWDSNNTVNHTETVRTESKWSSFINSHAKNVTAWFLASMMVQGIFFLPLPALLIFNFGAPTYILVFTLGLFFANLIAGMSSSGIKTIIYLFAASVIVNLSILILFTI